MAITLQTIESLPLVEEVNENTSLVGWDGEKTVRVASDMVGGSGLPEGGEPYKQLVTDGEGKAGWEERLAWLEDDKVEITWDGNTDGLETVDNFFYKVSDLNVSNEAIKVGSFVSTTTGDTDDVTEISSLPADRVLYTDDYAFALGVVITRMPNIEISVSGHTFTFPSPGVWFGKENPQIYINRLTTGTEIVHKIPYKYIPNIVITKNDDGTYECNVGYDEFYDLIMNGAPVAYINTNYGDARIIYTVVVKTTGKGGDVYIQVFNPSLLPSSPVVDLIGYSKTDGLYYAEPV